MLPRVDSPAALSGLIDQLAAAARRGGRTPDDVTIVAATKYVDLAVMRDLVARQITSVGESRFGPLVEKYDALRDETDAPQIDWHFIGRVQSREVVRIAERVSMIHSLCSMSAAKKLAAAQLAAMPTLLVQVNIAGDPAKDGVAPDDVEAFLSELPDGVSIAGFMTMPAAASDPEQSRASFTRLRELRDRLRPLTQDRHDLTLLSMGTSQDAVVAVEEGATHVRLGRALMDTLG